MNASQHFDTDVAIIGYGPSGVSAALCLGHAGIRVRAFERDCAIYPRARAVTVNDWTMRCFQSVGVADALAQNMDRTTALRWITYDGQELTRLNFGDSTLGNYPSSYSIYQPTMENTLREHAAKLGDLLEVCYGEEMVDIAQDAEGVTVTTRNLQTGATQQTRARYVLACDGGSSQTRERLGIKLVGETRETRWVVIDARVKRWWPERHILTFWADKQRPVVDIALAQGNHRWEFPLRPEEPESNFATHEQLWPLLESMGVTPNEVEIHQHAFYKHHVRHAERWREGRVFLVGDAAHLMPPFAGAGMQSGIRDAFNIGWKLAAVLQGRLPEAVLNSYEAERAPNVALMTGFSVHLSRLIHQELTEEELAAMAPDPNQPPPEPPITAPPFLVDGWFRGPLDDSSAVGKMLPQPQIGNAQGRLCWLDEELGNGFVLLGDGVDPRTLLSPAEQASWDKLGTRYLTVLSPDQRGKGSDDLIDLSGQLLAWLRKFGARAVAIRPDRFIAASDASGLAVPDAAQAPARQAELAMTA